MQVDTRPDTMSNIASYYLVNSQKLQRHYKQKVSGFKQWAQLSHADDYLIYPDNITDKLSIDEVSLSKGELYTFVTNKNSKIRNKKSVVAVINGTQAKTIQDVLEKIAIEQRNKVTEISMDMARNMSLAAHNSFPNASIVIDRFHVVKLVMDALQHVRVSFRWDAIKAENEAIDKAKTSGETYEPKELKNGETVKELLARSRYLLYKYEDDWTANQTQRATILFEEYPQLKSIYTLTLCFRNIYKNLNRNAALILFKEWKEQVIQLKIDQFNTVVYSINYHLDNIMNFFDNRSTNANAESFNSKIKGFRANLRGVTDVKFFLFRLEKLFA